MTRFLIVAILLVVFLAPASACCPFCTSQGQTLAGEINVADFIVYGKPRDPRPDKDDFTRGTTEIVVEKVIKSHPWIVGKKSFRINKLIPIDPETNIRMMIFCEVNYAREAFAATGVASSLVMGNLFDNPIDPYRGVEVTADSKMADYMKGAIDVREKDNISKLKFFFEYLEVPEIEISNDAHMEFGNSDYADVRKMAVNLPRERIMGWLKDPGTSTARLGFYGLLLGHCGTKEDGKVVRQLLDDPTRRFGSGLEGLLVAYTLLEPNEAWDYLTSLIKDPNRQEFAIQYAAIKVIRFFWDFRSDVISKERCIEATKLAVNNPLFGDMPIEDLRKWGRWELTDFVLKTAAQPAHKKEPMVRRATLKFMLAAAAANNAAAKEYVAQARKDDPTRVKLMEELIEQEQAAAQKAAEAAAKPAKKTGAGGD